MNFFIPKRTGREKDVKGMHRESLFLSLSLSALCMSAGKSVATIVVTESSLENEAAYVAKREKREGEARHTQAAHDDDHDVDDEKEEEREKDREEEGREECSESGKRTSLCSQGVVCKGFKLLILSSATRHTGSHRDEERRRTGCKTPDQISRVSHHHQTLSLISSLIFPAGKETQKRFRWCSERKKKRDKETER